MSKSYMVKEVFYSPQGEGHRVGTMNVFVRFAGCNLQCVQVEGTALEGGPYAGKKLVRTPLGLRPLQGNEIDAGFVCDTDFQGGERFSLEELVRLVQSTDEGHCGAVIFTGGEPTLQLDRDLCQTLIKLGYFLAIETNGTRELPRPRTGLLHWVSCSPKPGTTTVIKVADEVRCVLAPGQVPDTRGVTAKHHFVSPATHAPLVEDIHGWKGSAQDFRKGAIDWCVDWCKKNPGWRISMQMHKIIGVR